MQEDTRISEKVHRRCRVVFLRSFISVLFVPVYQLRPYNSSEVLEQIFAIL